MAIFLIFAFLHKFMDLILFSRKVVITNLFPIIFFKLLLVKFKYHPVVTQGWVRVQT